MKGVGDGWEGCWSSEFTDTIRTLLMSNNTLRTYSHPSHPSFFTLGNAFLIVCALFFVNILFSLSNYA